MRRETLDRPNLASRKKSVERSLRRVILSSFEQMERGTTGPAFPWVWRGTRRRTTSSTAASTSTPQLLKTRTKLMNFLSCVFPLHRGMHREWCDEVFASRGSIGNRLNFIFFFLPPFFLFLPLFSLLSLLSSFFCFSFLFFQLSAIKSFPSVSFSIRFERSRNRSSPLLLLLQKEKKRKRERERKKTTTTLFPPPLSFSSCLIEYFENEAILFFAFDVPVVVVVERRAENERLRIRRQRDERTTETKRGQGRGF